MSTVIVSPTCRSCVYWVSCPEMAPEGVCSCPLSPAYLGWTTAGVDSCSEHDPYFPGQHTLTERECVRCGHVNLYAAGYDGVAYCAVCYR